MRRTTPARRRSRTTSSRELERRVLLSVLDRKWREHLYEMDYLREGIGLRAYSQRDPLVEYQREGFDLFSAMMDSIKEESVGYLFNVEVTVNEPTRMTDGGGGRGWRGAEHDRRARSSAASSRRGSVSRRLRRSCRTRHLSVDGDRRRPRCRRPRRSSTSSPACLATSHVPAARARSSSAATATRASQRLSRNGRSVRPGGG